MAWAFDLFPEDLPDLDLDIANLPKPVRPYLIGRDLVQLPKKKYVIDFYGLSAEEARKNYPILFQHLLKHVKPERDQNRRKTRQANWWIFGENAPALRRAIASITRYIATCRTSKHRVFTFLSSDYLPDAKIVGIGLSDAYFLGVLSSRIHTTFAMKIGGWLGVGNDSNYNHADCFNKFPFPSCDEQQKARIRELGETLDAHRKQQLAKHPDLTITGIYNVLENLNAGKPLTEKEKIIHEQGLVSILKQIHDILDVTVFEAYKWPTILTDEEILERLIALNAERATEERNGFTRWLRPEFQNPQGASQSTFAVGGVEAKSTASTKREKIAWPSTLAEQAKAVRNALAAQAGPVTPAQLAENFKGGRDRAIRVAELLETLASLGQARQIDANRFVA